VVANSLVIALALTHAHDGAPGGLVLGGIGQEDAAGGLLLTFLALYDDAVAERNQRRLLAGGLGGGGCHLVQASAGKKGE